jgi:hypothetical protein
MRGLCPDFESAPAFDTPPCGAQEKEQEMDGVGSDW